MYELYMCSVKELFIFYGFDLGSEKILCGCIVQNKV
jgi:hypothetical protein